MSDDTSRTSKGQDFIDFSRFTAPCREALSIAQALAVRRGHGTVEEDHLLLALCQQQNGIVSRVLVRLGSSVASLASFLESRLEKIPARPSPETRIGSGVLDLFQRAARAADAESSRFLATTHLFVAVLESDCLCGELLRSRGISRNRVLLADVAERSVTSPLERRCPNLKRFGRDLTVDAARGRLDPVIGRDPEVSRVIRILLRRSKNNPILVGEPGVGKTAVAEAVAEARFLPARTTYHSRAAAAKIVPSKYPNWAAKVGPTRGPAPAMAAKWSPKRTQRLVGT